MAFNFFFQSIEHLKHQIGEAKRIECLERDLVLLHDLRTFGIHNAGEGVEVLRQKLKTLLVELKRFFRAGAFQR